MTVRAKFVVNSIERNAHSVYPHVDENGKIDYKKPVATELHSIKMAPVYGNGDLSHENTKFWNASPSGSLMLGTVNLDAAKQFELGKEYYIDFTPAA
jgi:hypothetical protein